MVAFFSWLGHCLRGGPQPIFFIGHKSPAKPLVAALVEAWRSPAELNQRTLLVPVPAASVAWIAPDADGLRCRDQKVVLGAGLISCWLMLVVMAVQISDKRQQRSSLL